MAEDHFERPLRIGLLTHSVNPRGGVVHTLELARALHEALHERRRARGVEHVSEPRTRRVRGSREREARSVAVRRDVARGRGVDEEREREREERGRARDGEGAHRCVSVRGALASGAGGPLLGNDVLPRRPRRRGEKK